MNTSGQKLHVNFARDPKYDDSMNISKMEFIFKEKLNIHCFSEPHVKCPHVKSTHYIDSLLILTYNRLMLKIGGHPNSPVFFLIRICINTLGLPNFASQFLVWPPSLLMYSVSTECMLRRSLCLSPYAMLCHFSTS